MRRRDWFKFLGAACIGPGLPRDYFVRDDLQSWDVPSIRRHLVELGLGPCAEVESERYQAVGDASKSFLEDSVTLAEGLARDFLRHLRVKGFATSEPAAKLILIGLKDAGSYGAFLKTEPGPEEGGIYLIDGNVLCFFDKRTSPIDQKVAQRMNTLMLCHEATHQLSFNMGLFRRDGDVPLVIDEGLAQYGETRSADGRTPIGHLNGQRLDVLRPFAISGKPGRPLHELLDDAAFDGPDLASVDLAYAQSWLLVYWLFDRRERSEKLKQYLQAIRERTDASNRLADFETHLGELGQIDEALVRFARKLARG